MYNYWAIDTGKLCPTGWHVPTVAEWQTLLDFLGDYNQTGGKLKKASSKPFHWQYPNIGATNEFGFTAMPGGYRDNDGSFKGMGSHGYLGISRDGISETLVCYGIKY